MKHELFIILSSAVAILAFDQSEITSYESANHESDHIVRNRSAEDYNDHFMSPGAPIMTVRWVDPRHKAINNISFQKIRNTLKDLFTFREIQSEEAPTKPVAADESTKYPTTIYPEILVFIENSLHVRLGANVNNTIKYAVTYWSSVDKYFRNFTEPKIRLNLAKIVIGLDHNSTLTMMKINEVEDYNGWSRGTLDGNKAFDGLLDYFITEERLSKFSYDIVAAMTSFEMKSPPNDEKVVGLGRGSNTCYNGRNEQRKPGLVLISDLGGFDGILVAVHELGHVFNAPHDDSELCIDKYGEMKQNIMRPERRSLQTQDIFTWSPCSLEWISFTVKYSECFYNIPDVNASRIITPTPGKLQTANEQCQRIAEKDACTATQDSCTVLRCARPRPFDFLCATLDSPPADGTACGNGRRHCMQGECIDY